jgi:ATP-dependent Clp protease ATP-binding subunit ClpC
MEILVRRQKNNPVLVGEAGVGKTAIVELFATRLIKNLVPFVLEGRRIISIDLGRIVAGARFRGEFELRFQKLLDEVLASPNTIIFIDEIHNITGSGSAEGSIDAANLLKPVLSRSGFQCIGATTTKEYQRIEKIPR